VSYILDALRKSDQQRQRGTAPTLHSAHFTTAPRPAGARWLYAIGGLILAGAAFGIGWVRPWHSEPPQLVATQPASPASQPNAPAVTENTPVPAPTIDAASAPTVQNSPAPASKFESARVSSSEASKGLLKRSAPTPGEAPEALPEKPAETASILPPQEEKIPDLADLPASVRQEIPAMSISVHAYSRTPKDRLVGVNDRLLHEGDSLTPQLVLQKITPEGMIFSFKGMRFQRGVQ
jgi:general secretion pathway protein B